MSVKELIAAATLPAMIASPAVAANPAESLSLHGDSSDAAAVSQAAAQSPIPIPPAEPRSTGISPALMIGGLAVVLVVIGAVALGSGHHDNHPASA